MPYPDALKTNPQIIFFTDFDGTITLQDSRFADIFKADVALIAYP